MKRPLTALLLPLASLVAIAADQKYLAVCLSAGGGETGRLHVIDLAGGSTAGEPIDHGANDTRVEL